MLSNAYFLEKIRFDTAENEPAKSLQKIAKFANFAEPNPITLTLTLPDCSRSWCASSRSGPAGEAARRRENEASDFVYELFFALALLVDLVLVFFLTSWLIRFQ